MTQESPIVLNPFEQTFGMPPASHVSDTVIVNSMPVLNIIPCVPHFESGLTLFRVNAAWDKYNAILKSLGFTLSTPKKIRLAFIADNFPTDSFSNEYGETFLQKFTDVASQGMQQIAQMTGASGGIQGMKNLGESFKDIGDQMGGTLGGIIGAGGSGALALGEGLGNLKTNMGSQSGFMKGSLDTLDKLVAGNRVDFPQIWRNSAYTPAYTTTIRLYNPNPGSPKSTTRHIIGPLAVILCLAIPRSEDGKTFNWPFFHKVECPGLYNLSPAVITNVTVVKGGDQQQIAFNQKLAMVDVRIDFASLYGTMILEEKNELSNNNNRPTVRNYLKSLQADDPKRSYTRKEMIQESGSKAAVVKGPSVKISAIPDVTSASARKAVESVLAKNAATRGRQAPTVSEQEVDNRVPSSLIAREKQLTEDSPPDFIESETEAA